MQDLFQQNHSLMLDEMRRRKKLHSIRPLGLSLTEKGPYLMDHALGVKVPMSLVGAAFSNCGYKEILNYRQLEYETVDGGRVLVPSASFALLSIDRRSPYHVHWGVIERYLIRKGHGWFLVNGVLHEVGEGDSFLILPGVAHGLVSAIPGKPLVVEMTFDPGLALTTYWPYRDELNLAMAWQLVSVQLASRGRRLVM